MVFTSEGDGGILATDNGCQTSMERMRLEGVGMTALRKAFHGKCLVVVKGKGSVTVKSATLNPAWIEI